MKYEPLNRTKLFIGTIFLNAFIVWMMLFNPRADTSLPSYWLSILVGLGLGILTCVYMRAVWDPVHLELKNPNAETANPRLMPIVVIGGILFARLVLDQLSSEIGTAIANIGAIWVIILTGSSQPTRLYQTKPTRKATIALHTHQITQFDTQIQLATVALMLMEI